MPVISMFYGIIIRMFYFDNKKHKKPHIHVDYQDENAVINIPDDEILEGSIQKNKLKLVSAQIEIHKDELMADWKLAVEGQQVFKIEALKQEILFMFKILKLQILDDYKLHITFYNKEEKIFNVKPYLDKGVFNELKDKTYFSSVKKKILY